MIRRYNRRNTENAFLEIHRLNQNTDRALESTSRYPVENISRGGLRFYSNQPFVIDERIEVILHLSDGATHSATGRICYCQTDEDRAGQWGYGISFLDNFLEITSCL
jgi:hypothetical protein